MNISSEPPLHTETERRVHVRKPDLLASRDVSRETMELIAELKRLGVSPDDEPEDDTPGSHVFHGGTYSERVDEVLEAIEAKGDVWVEETTRNGERVIIITPKP